MVQRFARGKKTAYHEGSETVPERGAFQTYRRGESHRWDAAFGSTDG